MIQNQTLSTVAFLSAGAVVLLYIFKVAKVKHAILIGGGLAAVGFITQPPQS